MRFCDIGIVAEQIVGRNITINELFDKRILIEKVKIAPTKFPGKNSSGLRLQMQVVLATFNDTADDAGDYFVKDNKGIAIGERRSCFTGSDSLISAIQHGEERLHELRKEQNDIDIYPIDTTIVRVGRCFQFT